MGMTFTCVPAPCLFTQHCLRGNRWDLLLRFDKFCTMGPTQGFQREDLSAQIRCRGTVGCASGRNHASLDVRFSRVGSSGTLLITPCGRSNTVRNSWDAVNTLVPCSKIAYKWGQPRSPPMSIFRGVTRRRCTSDHSPKRRLEFQLKLRFSRSSLLLLEPTS